ncbi:hypothetical protein BWI17_20020 [Betaproteobacteria bacterium GR16-43]|nr:hypothetical protein BWI17_20020 [Betaproteobacteria bacterium GR16-43]
MRAAVLRLSALIAAMAAAIPARASDADPVEGVWDFTVTRRDCASGAVLGTQRALTVFHRGGTLSNDNSTAPGSHGAMFGTWKRGSRPAYAVQMVFMRFNADGTMAGTQKVVRSLALAADGNTLTGTVVAHTLDATAAGTAQGCATETGIRVY